MGYDELRVGDSLVGGFEDRGAGILDECVGSVLAGLYEARRGGEDAARVCAGEMPGFGDGVEDLRVRHAVDGEVVDGFVHDGPPTTRGELCFGEHGKDGFSVGFGEWFALVTVQVSILALREG